MYWKQSEQGGGESTGFGGALEVAWQYDHKM